MSNVSKRRKEGSRAKIKSMGDHKEFLKRITKTLYYGELPTLPCLSLPVTEISCEVWSVSQRGRSLRRLHADAAADIARSACVSPCALVLAVLYLERLRTANPDYLAQTPPTDLFLVSLMVGNKFLQDDGEDDEVICSEWAASGGIDLKQLKKLEVEFLSAIDWNVFVSEKSFETGLQWLEREVALRQARARGFFTYADLAAATAATRGRRALLRALAGGLGAGWLAAAAAYLASLAALLALLAAALLLARAAPPRAATLSADVAPDAAAADADALLARIDPANATTHRLLAEVALDAAEATERLRCCTAWIAARAAAAEEARGGWADAGAAPDPRAPEPWWSTTAVMSWLYQSSLIGPMRRWLGRAGEAGAAGAAWARPRWAGAGRLAPLLVSVSDR